MKKVCLPIRLPIGLAILCFSILFAPSVHAQKTGLKKGNTAPEIQGIDVDKAPVRLSDFKGKVVIVHFWAGWAMQSTEENKNVQAVFEDYKSKSFKDADGLIVLAVELGKNFGNDIFIYT